MKSKNHVFCFSLGFYVTKSNRSEARFDLAEGGGGAGYCPRVQSAYSDLRLLP